jgi:hypothetical protein
VHFFVLGAPYFSKSAFTQNILKDILVLVAFLLLLLWIEIVDLDVKGTFSRCLIFFVAITAVFLGVFTCQRRTATYPACIVATDRVTSFSNTPLSQKERDTFARLA